MATSLKLRRGTTAQHASFTGSIAEVTVDTDKDTVVVHDGSTAGGFPLARASGSAISVTSLTDSGNLTFTSTGNRITGDFSNATTLNRVAFQTSTTNSATSLEVLPNGTSSTSALILETSSSDPANAAWGRFIASSTDVRVESGIRGTGTYLPITMYTGGTERMRIDSSGNVGIGTSSIGERLTVRQDQNAQSRIALSNQDSGSSAESSLRLGCFGGSWDISNGSAARNSNALTFSQAGGAERMRIDSSGNLLVGTTTRVNNERLSVKTTGAGVWPIIMLGEDRGAVFRITASSGYAAYFERNNGTYVGDIFMTSSGTTTFNTASDYRLKDNIAPMTGALAKVALLKPCTYTWKSDGSDGEGFIAHEIAEVVPQAVRGEKDAVDADGNPVYQGIDTSFLVATLTAAIQELKAEFDEYKATHP